ncbi:MAG: DUF3857 domain-containing protein [Chitinophagaceae bacterium]|nr:DUF3857 domain-containing protein [Chitinophagaceae bacterium]
MKFCLILACLFIYRPAYNQSPLPEFGSFTADEINLKECSFDKDAGAVMLLDEAVSDYNDEHQLITRRRIRIKILHQRELDRANIRIRFYSKDKFEYISNIKGVSFNPEDGVQRETFLENRSIYTEKEDNVYSSIKFALPNVKPGSIIEYSYTSYMKHYGGLSAWIFQNEIPTIKSCYLLSILPNTEFQYLVQKKSTYPISVKPMPEEGKIYFEMNNIPGLRSEPYMDAVRDYLQRVEFQLSSYMSRSGNKTRVNQTWKDLAYDLTTERAFGGAIKKDLPNTAEIKEIVSKEGTDSGKVAAIYNYVRKKMTWNGYYSIYAVDGIKNAWERGTGHVAEINLILINLLQAFNIEVYPLLVAERDFGRIDSTYPFIDRFNKVTALVRVNGRSIILDATQKFSPAGLTPYQLLNTLAFIVDKKNYNLVRIGSGGSLNKNYIIVNAGIDEKGLLTGTTSITSTGYAKQMRTEKISADPKKFIREVLEEPGSDVMIDDLTYENLDDDNKPLIQNIRFHYDLNVNGGYAFFIPNLFMGISKNPFTAAERFTNVNFGYPSVFNLSITLKLPEKAKTDKLPEEKTIVAPDGWSAAVHRSVNLENNVITINIAFRQTNTLVSYNDYTELRSLYSKITDMLNEPLVIKIQN